MAEKESEAVKEFRVKQDLIDKALVEIQKEKKNATEEALKENTEMMRGQLRNPEKLKNGGLNTKEEKMQRLKPADIARKGESHMVSEKMFP